MLKTSSTRVLVVEDVALEAKLLMRALADFGYTNLVHRPDVASALTEIEANPPQIVVTDLSLGAKSGCELTRAIRARVNEDYVYVIMLTGVATDQRLKEAFSAGVDDFVVKPFRAEEMVARMRAGERVVDLEWRLRIRSRELETALRRIDVTAAQRALAKASATVLTYAPSDAEGLGGLVALNAWTNAGDILAKSLSEFLQLPCEVVPIRDDFEAPFVADVLLAEPTRQLEVGVSVLADDASMGAMAMQLLGDNDDPEGSKALVLEVANIMMGSLKSAFIANGHTFTGGIPAELSFAEARGSLDAHPVRYRLGFKCGEANLEIWLRAREKKNAKVLGKDLLEGMVIGEDVHDAKGMLLIRAGVRLTQTAADRIARFIPTLEITVGG